MIEWKELTEIIKRCIPDYPGEIEPQHRLKEDLYFSSLSRMLLCVALEQKLEHSLDIVDFVSAETAKDLLTLVNEKENSQC